VGKPPLLLASLSGAADIVEMLLAKGAKVDLQDDAGMSPFPAACEKERLDVARKLWAAGADPRADHHDGCQAIHLAASADKKDVVRFLVEECGVDPNARDRQYRY
jgi:ankyrin repeat protein